MLFGGYNVIWEMHSQAGAWERIKIALNLKEKIAKKIVAFISKNFNFKKN